MNFKEKYGYDHNDMKKALLKMGGEVSRNNENVINILRDCGTLPEKKGGNVWVFKGHTYDFICIRYKALTLSDIKRLLELLNFESLPSRHPLRRILVRMMIQDKISIEEFYEVVRAQKVFQQVSNQWASVDEDEVNMILHEIKVKESEFERDQTKRRVWLKQAYRRMRVPVPDWIDDVIIKDYTSFDQIPNLGLWFRTKSNRGRFLLLDQRLYEIADNYISNLGFIIGFFTRSRRNVTNNGGALYIMDNCQYNTSELVNVLEELMLEESL